MKRLSFLLGKIYKKYSENILHVEKSCTIAIKITKKMEKNCKKCSLNI